MNTSKADIVFSHTVFYLLYSREVDMFGHRESFVPFLNESVFLNETIEPMNQ